MVEGKIVPIWCFSRTVLWIWINITLHRMWTETEPTISRSQPCRKKSGISLGMLHLAFTTKNNPHITRHPFSPRLLPHLPLLYLTFLHRSALSQTSPERGTAASAGTSRNRQPSGKENRENICNGEWDRDTPGTTDGAVSLLNTAFLWTRALGMEP